LSVRTACCADAHRRVDQDVVEVAVAVEFGERYDADKTSPATEVGLN
jgi:hypothetical protein